MASPSPAAPSPFHFYPFIANGREYVIIVYVKPVTNFTTINVSRGGTITPVGLTVMVTTLGELENFTSLLPIDEHVFELLPGE